MNDRTKYHARDLGKVETKPGCWNHTRVGVFDGDTQVGEYLRNYPSFAAATFAPFERDGKWYALYSRHYTGTRVMSLPDCTDLGGEEPDGFGFCPAELYVPELIGQRLDPADPAPPVANHDADRWAKKVPLDGGRWRYYWPTDPEGHAHLREAYQAEYERSHAARAAWRERHPFVTEHARFAFVAGCHWGDDSGGWKLETIDLSRAPDGVIARDQRFGYLQLPAGVALKDAVDLDPDDLNAPPGDWRIKIALPAVFDLTGRKLGLIYDQDNPDSREVTRDD